jgi:single-strand DNA-binding protein
MAANINRVVLVGNLTRDPELRHTPGGTPVCSLRVAVNDRKRDESGNWVDAPNYFSVSVFGNQAENCAQYLSKGRPVGIDGSVQFLGGRGDGDGGGNQFVPAGAAQESADFPAAADDDIPF